MQPSAFPLVQALMPHNPVLQKVCSALPLITAPSYRGTRVSGHLFPQCPHPNDTEDWETWGVWDMGLAVLSRCPDWREGSSIGVHFFVQPHNSDKAGPMAENDTRAMIAAGTRATTFFSKGVWSTLVVQPRLALSHRSCFGEDALAVLDDTSDEDEAVASGELPGV